MSRENKEQAILSYNDSILYESDVELLDENQWLNDRLIGFAYEYLERESFASDALAFVNPSTVQCLKMSDDMAEAKACFIEPLDLDKKRVVFLPLNNNQHATRTGGSHWSLLVVDNKRKLTYHFDSCHMLNDSEAREFFDKAYFGSNQRFEQVSTCPTQSNSSDCGMYVLAITEALAKAALEDKDLAKVDLIFIDAKFIRELRANYKKIISSLAEKNK